MKRNYIILCLTPDECEALGHLIQEYLDIYDFILECHIDDKEYTKSKEYDILESILKRFL